MSDKIKEEIFFWYRNDLVSNFHKKTETFGRSQIQALSNACAEILSSCRRINFKCFICIIRKVNFVEYLSGFVLNCFNFDLKKSILKNGKYIGI